jgi:hypothetical protein
MDPMAQAPNPDLGVEADILGMDDEFAGADTASMETDIEGREMKEDAYLNALRMIKEAQSDGKVSSVMLQKAFNVMKLSEHNVDEGLGGALGAAFGKISNMFKKTKPKKTANPDHPSNANALEDPTLQKQIDDMMPDTTIPHDDLGGDLIGQQLKHAGRTNKASKKTSLNHNPNKKKK